MKYPNRLAILIATCGLLYSLAPAPVDGEFLLELPVGENIRRVSVHANKAHVSIATPVSVPGQSAAFELKERVFPLASASSSGTGRPVEASSQKPTAPQDNGSSSKAPTDFRKLIFDTMEGLSHVSYSDDGKRFLTVVHWGSKSGSANVTAWFTEPRLRPGPMTNIDGLIHASISGDGDHIYIQTTDGLFVHETESFGHGEASRQISTLGQPHTIFEWSGGDGGQRAEYFFLIEKLVVKLYSMDRGQLEDGTPAPLEPLAMLETNDYAIATLFDADSRLMIVVERHRVRVARVEEGGLVLLAGYVLEPGVEFRSCQASHRKAEAAESTPAVIWALGVRQKVQRPTLQGAGSAEFGALVVALPAESKPGGGSFEVLSNPIWKSCERWNGYSPRLQFNEDGSELIAYTRDKAWEIEVQR